ncbi:MAG: hypothetical protein ACJAS1_001855 [Oleiphilaceae bacterium]|jgi:hypothetical protein
MPDNLFEDAFNLVKKLWPQIEVEAQRNITMYSKFHEQYLN